MYICIFTWYYGNCTSTGVKRTQIKMYQQEEKFINFGCTKEKKVVFSRHLKPNLTINVTELQKSLSSGQKNFAKDYISKLFENHAISLF